MVQQALHSRREGLGAHTLDAIFQFVVCFGQELAHHIRPDLSRIGHGPFSVRGEWSRHMCSSVRGCLEMYKAPATISASLPAKRKNIPRVESPDQDILYPLPPEAPPANKTRFIILSPSYCFRLANCDAPPLPRTDRPRRPTPTPHSLQPTPFLP